MRAINVVNLLLKVRTIINRLGEAHYLFVLLALVFGITFVKIIPPLWGVDETSHFARVYQLAHGHLTANRTQANYGGEIPNDLLDLINYTKADLLDNKGGGLISRQDVDSQAAYNQLTSKKFSQQQEHYLWTASYSPVSYIGSLVGVLAADAVNASIGHTIFLARLGGLLLYIAIIYAAIRLLQQSRLKWLIFVVALFPSSLFLASVVTADNMVISLSLLFIALFIRLLQTKGSPANNKLIYSLAVVAILMPLVKLNYIFLSLGLLLVPNRLFKTSRAATLIKTGISLLAAILALYWTSLTDAIGQPPVSQRPDSARLYPTKQLLLVIHHPLYFIDATIRSAVVGLDYYLQSMTALMGWNWIGIPYIFIFALWLALFLAAVFAKKELISLRKRLLILGGLIVLGIISIFGAFYLDFSLLGSREVDGVQGRYFIPFLVPAVMLVAAYVPFEIKLKDKIAPYIFGSIGAVCLAVSVLYYYLMTY